MTLAGQASLRMMQLVFEYQLLFNYLETLPISTQEELKAVLHSAVALAVYTVIELPAAQSSDDVAQWYGQATSPQQVRAILLPKIERAVCDDLSPPCPSC